MKTAYVTGGTGCVGRNIINELLRKNYRVIAAHRRSSAVSRLAGLDVQLREVDLYNPEAVEQSIPEGVSVIFHVAASTSHWPLEKNKQWQDNVLATRNLVRAALRKNIDRFVFTSTAAVWAFLNHSPEEIEKSAGQYVSTKRLSELEVEKGIAQGLDAVILRPVLVIGAYDYNGYSNIFTSMAAGKWLGVLPDGIEFSHAQDVARAHVRAYEHGRTGERYVLHGHRVSWLEVYQKTAKLTQAPPPQRTTPLWLISIVSHPMLWFSYLSRKRPLVTPELVRLIKSGGNTPLVEIQKTERDLGYRSAGIDRMLNDCHAWLVKEGLLPCKYPKQYPLSSTVEH
jgi:nucleoside-diphosphate-sugar epimerase